MVIIAAEKRGGRRLAVWGLRLRGIAAVSLLTVLASAPAPAEDRSEVSAPTLRPVLLRDGCRGAAPDRDLTRLRETEIYKRAKAAGIHLENPKHPLLVTRYGEGRLFYLFYKTAESEAGDRPYLIQRIRKTERTWASPDAKPEVRVTYQVEVFKTFAGEIKRPDQHFGSFGLRGNHRREVVKEYEIGYGEVPGVCEGTDWPFEPRFLSKIPQPYAEEPGLYDEVAFLASTHWKLDVAFGADGMWRVASPELGFDAPGKMPDPASAWPEPDGDSGKTELVPGRGTKNLVIGEIGLDGIRRLLGDPRHATRFASGKSSYTFRGRLTANLDENGVLYFLSSGSGFAGRTTQGIRHGDSRWRVMEVMGVPEDQSIYGWTWSYDGVRFWFDGFDRVGRIGIYGQ